MTPQFGTFLVSLDGQGWQPSASRLIWKLHKGVNRIEARVRIRAGVQGTISFIQVEWIRESPR